MAEKIKLTKEQLKESKAAKTAAEAGGELSLDELERVSGGANGVERPCPTCGRELQWSGMAKDFICANKNCPDYIPRSQLMG